MIDRMEHVAVLAPANLRESALAWLHRAREIHLADINDESTDWQTRFHPLTEDAAACEAAIAQLQSAQSLLNEYRTDKGDFLTGFFPVRIVASREEVASAAKGVDPAWLAKECARLRSDIETASEQHFALVAERERLNEFAFLGELLPKLGRIKNFSVRFAITSAETAAAFVKDDRLQDGAAAIQVKQEKNSVTFALVAAAPQTELLSALMADYALREIALPASASGVEAELRRIDAALADQKKEIAALKADAARLAEAWAKLCDLALSHHESERARIQQSAQAATSRNILAARGYVRADRLGAFKFRLEANCPGATLTPCPSPADEEPPVSLSWSDFFRPMGFLVKMFGLPRYNTFDPTAYLSLSFLVFFGICFGDVVYGAMLIALSIFLRRRFHDQPGLTQFFSLFTYAGASTIIFGIALGSCASDLPMYIWGENKGLDYFRNKFMLLDPLQKPVLAIIIAVGIGVANQFFGIVLRCLRDWWRGDIKGAIYDGVFWLAYLSSLLTAALGGLAVLPDWTLTPALILLAASAAGLVLTQGREQEGLAAKAIAGVVSLYGILGNYGTSAFIGDVLSYTRLLALGMTTSIIGMAFNMVADLVKVDVPVVGWLLFAAVVIFGHTFNFVMSILGSFIHPARLIFLEFFGRFFEGGGREFKPFGFQSLKVELADEPAK